MTKPNPLQVLWDNAELSGEREAVSGDTQSNDKKQNVVLLYCWLALCLYAKW